MKLICPFCRKQHKEKDIRYWYTKTVYKCPSCGCHLRLPDRGEKEETKSTKKVLFDLKITFESEQDYKQFQERLMQDLDKAYKNGHAEGFAYATRRMKQKRTNE